MTHGHRSKGQESPEYRSWRGMIERCYNPKNISFPHYGARCIAVCPKWRASFSAFLKDMGPRTEGYTIDRKNNDLGYLCGRCKACGRTKNCQWSSWHDQIQNQRRCHFTNLVRAQAEKVRKLHDKGATAVKLAARFKVSHSFMCKFLRSTYDRCCRPTPNYSGFEYQRG
jgi:hypothetical protein